MSDPNMSWSDIISDQLMFVIMRTGMDDVLVAHLNLVLKCYFYSNIPFTYMYVPLKSNVSLVGVTLCIVSNVLLLLFAYFSPVSLYFKQKLQTLYLTSLKESKRELA